MAWQYNSFQENQTDLEVIFEFLEEYYRQNTGVGSERVEENCVLPTPLPVKERNGSESGCEHLTYEGDKADLQPTQSKFNTTTLNQTTVTLSELWSAPNSVSKWKSSSCHTEPAMRGRKVRLFHFLFEMLEDPDMAHCVSWVPEATGVFSFSSKYKDQVAALWGQRKGNRRLMTYQKMSRALRNYRRSGEIFKVKKKLTYQFSRDTLSVLRMCHGKHSRAYVNKTETL
ncbi:transcription factor PU.1 [Osmerus mordax]|uniref:transcription factor PU.1 n=1 Tax=Osmerus mordax TaxID=8014 RepID=UPI00350EC4C0